MAFDPRNFSKLVAVDTCSIWNILSAKKLSLAAFSSGVHFIITPMVNYECLYKTRKQPTKEQDQLKERLNLALSKNQISIQHCDLRDLITIALKAPKKLSSGELSCIAMSYNLSTIAVMTDEKLARKFSEDTLALRVETTPKLYGWLHYNLKLNDTDHTDIVKEHESFERRPLTRYFNEAYETALQYRITPLHFTNPQQRI
ncbi:MULTISPECIES: hypothetical protein [unclassified Pseudomonas]|uniref:hypothetical protein n=1 Tax=unclassified Pseudomonas TaxID=196821 RepID=UPI001F58EE67|nr:MULTISPECIES: hypothetical protein [unclassified Pseudomonas]